jgi:hypothetical protein
MSVNRNVLRYSIAFMLFVCLCVAGFLAGYRAGYPDGYASGQAKRKSEQPYPKVYTVGDLIRKTDDDTLQIGDPIDYQALIDATQSSVFPDEWEALGGPSVMVPIHWREALVVNATSGVHDRLEAFFGDLSSLKVAVAASRRRQEASRLARDEWIADMLEPASKYLGKSLELIDADFDIVGSWNVERTTAVDPTATMQYTFVDSNTVQLPSPEGAGKSLDAWYFVSPGSVVVDGNAHIAATAVDGTLVMIPNNDRTSFFVATRAVGEP